MLSVALALVISVAVNTHKPVIQNPGFEASPFLTGWKTNARTEHENGRAPTFIADRNDPKEGDQSLVIEALDPADAVAQQTLGYYVRFANSINLAPVQVGLEGSDSLRKKYGRERLITDDNMGREWELEVPIFWR